MTQKDKGILVLREQGPHKLISYGELYTVDYTNDSIGTSLFATDNLASAEDYFKKVTSFYSEPIQQLKNLLADDRVHRYDVWDDVDGPQAYLFSDCPPDKFDELQAEFEATRLKDTDKTGYTDALVAFVESKEFAVVSISKPKNNLYLVPGKSK